MAIQIGLRTVTNIREPFLDPDLQGSGQYRQMIDSGLVFYLESAGRNGNDGPLSDASGLYIPAIPSYFVIGCSDLDIYGESSGIPICNFGPVQRRCGGTG